MQPVAHVLLPGKVIRHKLRPNAYLNRYPYGALFDYLAAHGRAIAAGQASIGHARIGDSPFSTNFWGSKLPKSRDGQARKLRRDYPRDAHVFVSKRGGPISPIGFHRLVQRLGEAAKMPFLIHPHMLRHACGFKLANDGHDTRALQHYLGHKNIQHTVRYTELAPDRFKDFWRN